jgi:RND family efflux transporter MFP subunit
MDEQPARLHEAEPEAGQAPGKLLRWGILLAVLVAVGVAAGLIPRQRQQAALRAETERLSVPVVNVAKPRPGQSNASLALPAEVKPWAEAGIYARANGYLRQRWVDIGSFVEEGQLLAEIDTPELDQDLERARAQLAQAEAARDLSKATAARWAQLIKSSSVSEQENAEKQTDFMAKTATADSARAEVRRLEKLRGFARVVAPFAGAVTIRNVDVGDLIASAGARELFHLTDTRKLRVFVPVPQAMSRDIQAGQQARVKLPESPERSFPARVIRTSGAIAADSRTLLVELELDNAKNDIIPGSYITVNFPGGTTQAPLSVPASSLRFRAEGPELFVVGQDGRADLRRVRLGWDLGQRIEITQGLEAQDSVVVNPPESLKGGAPVKVAEAAPGGAAK